jgi:hypothetical protein
MGPMRCRAALCLALALALATGACADNTPRMPSTCTDTDAAGYEQALRAAPDAVRLPGGTPISLCLWRVRSDAELQDLGAVVHEVAERLALRARDARDAAAARELGYLGGAAATGAEHSGGISAELARRVEVAGSGLADLSPALARALRDGQTAGAARG